MPAQPIYLDAEEEISELIDRLRQTSTEDVRVVVPARSRIGQSRFNFRLLRDYARRMGKRIAIISPDVAVQQLATESGFSAFSAVDDHGVPEPEPALAMAGVGAASAPPAAPPRPRQPEPATPGRTPKLTVTPHHTLASTDPGGGRRVIYAGAALLVFSAFLLAAILVPAATVTLTAKAQPLSDTTEVIAAPNSAPVKVRTVTATRDSSKQFKPTGVKITPAVAAGGSLTISNSCEGSTWILKQGQIVSTAPGSAGIQFVLQSGVTVKDVPQGVAILAAATGPVGNVGAGTITNIYNYAGARSGCVTASNPAATSGGADEVRATFISQGDLDSAKAALEGDLRGTLIDTLTRQAGSNEKLADTVDYTSKFTSDHPVNDGSAVFNATVTMTGNGAIYNVDDVKAALRTDLAKHVPPSFELTDNPVQSDFHVSQSTSDGHITFAGTAKGFVAPKLDFTKIRSRLLGSSTASARIYLQTLPVETADVKEKPFSLPLLPFLSSRIDIRYVVDTGGVPLPTK